MRNFVIFSLAMIAIAGCGDQAKDSTPATAHPIKKTMAQSKAASFDGLKNDSGLATYDAQRALTAFAEECPVFSTARSELLDLRIVSEDSVNSADRLRGWTQKYQLTFRVPDKTSSNQLRDASAAGNVCYYDLGGGNNPGFVPLKTACARICGKQSVGLVPVANLLWLDDPNSVAYRARYDRLQQEYRTEIAKWEKAAERGDYTAQRNLAYTYSTDSFIKADRILGCTWRLAITSRNSKATDSDVGNLNVECGQLTDVERQEATSNLAIIEDVLKSRRR